ncbi:hypothetical protein MBLNU459_g7534t2 [Dothideomycetes sp. NU459]
MSDTAGSGPAAASSQKPAVLIIGGLGYIGRFLANYIHANQLASILRVVDKQLPQLASLAPEHKEACDAPNFMQADASRPQSLARIFDLPENRQFDYVFNCGGETRNSQDDEVYKLRSYNLSLNIGREAATRGVKACVELSSGFVYDAKRDPPRKESDKLKPTLKMNRWKLAAEEDLSKIPGLALVVLRLAHVYGPYTGKWLGTQLAVVRIYEAIKKDVKWLWGPELRTATVHVDDVVRACWASAEWKARQARPQTAGSVAGPTTPASPTASRGPSPSTSVFNIVDHGNTDQGTLAKIIADIFTVDTGFQGTMINMFARMNLEHIVDELNDETLDPWADMQKEAGIEPGNSGLLSPFMEKELLRDIDLSLDGSKFEKEVGFK